MKNTRRTLCILMTCLICLTMAISANAALSLNTVPAGIYGTLSCDSFQRDTEIYGKTKVTTNPDNAQLLVKYTFNFTSQSQSNFESISNRGQTTFEYTIDCSVYPPEYRPTYVQYCGEVRGGSQSTRAYVTVTRGYNVDFGTTNG